MMTHTPGPWEFQRLGSVVVRIFGNDRILYHFDAPEDTEREANARLIASAPDLLAACEELLAADHASLVFTRCVDLARAAVAKARAT